MKNLLIALASGLLWYAAGLATNAKAPFNFAGPVLAMFGGLLAGILASEANRGEQ